MGYYPKNPDVFCSRAISCEKFPLLHIKITFPIDKHQGLYSFQHYKESEHFHVLTSHNTKNEKLLENYILYNIQCIIYYRGSKLIVWNCRNLFIYTLIFIKILRWGGQCTNLVMNFNVYKHKFSTHYNITNLDNKFLEICLNLQKHNFLFFIPET